ncbi:hypothetical protein M758_5G153800 [Ceratodon purpureus]|nr:hypothetical protein M758_5G153800 [Ceratodon purpureus]
MRIVAMDTIAGVSMGYLQSGRVIASTGISCALRSGEASQRCDVISSTACTSGQQSIVKIDGRGRLNHRCGGSSRFCNPRVFSDRLGGRLPLERGALQIRASGDNTLPLQVDTNGVATLEPYLDVSPSENNGRLSSRKEDGRERLEALIERVIFNCRFLTLMAVAGSLAGSVLCFLKGSLYVTQSFFEYFQAAWQGLGTSQVVFLLVEAVDVYLMGTVMLIFGMGLYELFVSTLDVAGDGCEEVRNPVCGSNLFGLFRMRERPKWLEIRSLDELKTKLGHVIVMILLVGMFEKSKKVPISSGLDLLCFSASILLSSGCLFLLSKLHSSTEH